MHYLTITTHFSSAHQLRSYPGDCARLHGHNWKIKLIFQAPRLNALGMGIDFKELKQKINPVIQRYDHQYLNDLPEFSQCNPTAEHIAEVLFRAIQAIPLPEITLNEVEVFESDQYSVIYRESSPHQ
ncbi:MAG: 6-carboxytetrahydropterin synthase QueD [Candidatus Delongbacteria bacterium]|nr:6-carboxytetrahydropterin synthase QueD [Candidatus Delongbacteria bacterium]